MKLTQFIIACTTGIFIYLLGMGIFGERGYLALQAKQEQTAAFRAHLAELEELQGELAGRVLALELNDEVLEREAHARGYLRDGQVWVRLGSERLVEAAPSPGKNFEYQSYRAPHGGYFLGASIGGFFLVLSLGLLRPREADGPIRPAVPTPHP